jgi:NAD(P)-dependent dehydrogenase (short-subunit alcohol dehydrogenase family)
MTDASRTALISGAGRGIGAACAERFLAEGWNVIGWDVAPGEDERVSWSSVDVSDWAAVEAAARDLPPLGAAVHCAAIALLTPTLEMPQEDWDRTISINLNGSYYLSRHVFPALDADDGVLVLFSSVSAWNITTNRAPYACSKAAILALTKVLAVEWARLGSKVRVLSVAPGLTLTEQPLQRVRSGALDEETLLSRVPTHRWVQPAEIASAIVRLVGDDFSALHGGNVLLDAGYDAWGGAF